ncbi:transporter substrate-binding domain-containing protein [Planomonospora sp. ID67723]|uniref:transporter substrate-binding domain-containing protein n=1 Tax=Planomonospora sp. ID67723 TaxID=2738134 RepID=UPI0018C44D5A|nr:transporter substrate-binding domain-containing protein [Planomonospora sp. ID67723]MBG0832569.1 transporter substrate-binding domain-containing protein [Planomonospora sp. ID67723]
MRITPWLAALAAGVLLTGCSADPDTPAGSGAADAPAAQSSAARSYVPDDIRRAGTLLIGSDLSYAPMEFMDGGEQAGFDVDLARAITARLGLKLEMRQTGWGDLLDKVESGELDAAMASITDTAERQGRVDFVDYLNVGSVVVAGVKTESEGITALCGRRVAVPAETIYVGLAEAQDKRCPAGKKLTVVTVGALSDSKQAVLDGKAEVYLDDFPPAAVSVQENPSLRISGAQIEAAPYGIAIGKDQGTLKKAIQLALYELFEDGTYDELLEKWKISEGSLKTGAINGGA